MQMRAIHLLAAMLVQPTRNFVTSPLRVHDLAKRVDNARALRASPPHSDDVAHYRRSSSVEAMAAALTADEAAEVERAREIITIDVAPKRGVLRKLWAVRRTLFIWSSIFGHALQVAVLQRKQNYFGLQGAELVEKRTKMAASLRDTLIRLGPTFIKIGQLMSTRVDVLPVEVLKELSKLQNEVPGFPAKRALKIIKNELGLDVNELFQSFDPQPLAAASLAQVHRAVLRTGEEVVVKVQRENLLDLFAIDLWNIKLAAWLADRFDPQTEATAANWKVR
jgi:predicted unusual protein kinase regulating ubiquinone biosynthesis (AarF/ABC1/UbiB family)